MPTKFTPTFPWKTLSGTILLTFLVLGSFGFLIHSLPDATKRLRDEQKEFILARGRILQLDEILTMSARMGAATGETIWITRYNHHEVELGNLIRRVYSIALNHQIKAAIALTNEANDELVAMEKQAFTAISKGNLKLAQSLLYSAEYRQQKRYYTQGMHDFLTRVDTIFEKEIGQHQKRYLMAKILGFLVCILVLVIWAVVISIVRRWYEVNQKNQQDLFDAKTFVSLAARAAGLAPWRYSSRTKTVELSGLCASMLGLENEGRYSVRKVLRKFEPNIRCVILTHIRHAAINPTSRNFEFECLIESSGQECWFSCSGSVVHMPQQTGNKPQLKIRGALHDITRRKRAEDIIQATNHVLEEEALMRLSTVETQANELRRLALELTQVEQKERQRLSMVLHDHLQQLLVSARFQLAMLVNQIPANNTPQTQILDEILDKCINESRSLSTELSPPVLQAAGFLAACHWLVRQMREAHGLEVRLQTNPDAEPENDTLRALLFHGLRELLFNVIKHSGVRSASVHIQLDAQDRIVILVEDHGRGFNASHYTNRTQNQPDSRLGLFSLRERIIALGGECRIESQPGQGALVRLTLSRGLASANRSIASIVSMSRATPLIPSAIIGSPTRVLIADNHSELRRGLCALLHSEGNYFVVGEANDGYQAIELHQRLKPDLIIMDLAMPRLSGIEATKAILAVDHCLPIVCLSIHETQEMQDAMLEAGAVAYLSKTEPTEVLLNTLTAHVGPKKSIRPRAKETLRA